METEWQNEKFLHDDRKVRVRGYKLCCVRRGLSISRLIDLSYGVLSGRGHLAWPTRLIAHKLQLSAKFTRLLI